MNNVILVPLHSTEIKFGYTMETKVGFTFAYITIFVISLFGNSVGLQVVVRAKTPSKRITYLLIKNLAVADLILTLTVMPYSVWFMYFDPNRWFGGTMGTITCKLFFYAILVSIVASVIVVSHCMSYFTEEPSAAMPSPRNEAPRQQNGGGRYILGRRENSGLKFRE